MKIFVTGTRGIPNIPGGIEKHCQELYPLIAQAGHTVHLATRKPYVAYFEPYWNGIKLEYLSAPRSKSFEAIFHTTLAVLKARLRSPDVLHIHAVGPGLVVPLARILGLKVVVTNHGPDYNHQKWTGMSKALIKFGEWLAGKFAHEVIVISRPIQEILQKRCNRNSVLIPNGVPIRQPTMNSEFIQSIGVISGKYILSVARFVPEKGLHDLIEAYSMIETQYSLVIAGDADHESEYSIRLRRLVGLDKRIVLTGYVTGEHLHQLYSHAALFVLPSYHEGLPISLLEAMSYGLAPLVSDIAPNREVNLDEKRYFKCGNVQNLRYKLETLLNQDLTEIERIQFIQAIQEKYNWEKIALQTIAVYEQVVNGFKKSLKKNQKFQI